MCQNIDLLKTTCGASMLGWTCTFLRCTRAWHVDAAASGHQRALAAALRGGRTSQNTAEPAWRSQPTLSSCTTRSENCVSAQSRDFGDTCRSSGDHFVRFAKIKPPYFSEGKLQSLLQLQLWSDHRSRCCDQPGSEASGWFSRCVTAARKDFYVFLVV